MKRFKKIAFMFVSLFGVVFSSCSTPIPDPKPLPVTQFSFSLTSDKINIGYGCYITNLYIFPDNATDKRIQYYAEDTTVASVEGEHVTGLKAGTTKIWGKTLDGSNLTYSVPLTVVGSSDVLVNEIKLSVQSLEHTVGDSFSLSIEVLPENATNKEFDLTISNDNISLTDNIVKCLKSGTTSIKAVAKDSGHVQSNIISLTIKDIPTTGISLSATKTRLETNKTAQLTVSYTPTTTKDKEVIYSTKSGKSNVITVSNSGLVTAVGEGKDTVVASLKSNPLVKDELEFEITDIEPTSVSISVPNKIYIGECYQATATVLPIDAFETTPVFSITSGNDVATITEDGLFLINKSGTFTIHVYLDERPSITGDLVVNIIGVNPEDPFADDIFTGA